MEHEDLGMKKVMTYLFTGTASLFGALLYLANTIA